MEVLRVIDLSVEVDGKRVLSNVNFSIEQGQTCILFGPNGSGKSSLLATLMGHPAYRITSGRIEFRGKDITGLSTHERVKLGMGMAFQVPPRVKEVKLLELLQRFAPIQIILQQSKALRMEELLERSLNVGFSGGEMKRSELLQLMLMQPKLVMLDEPDSGVDLENIALVGKAIRQLLQQDLPPSQRERSGLLITHTGHILHYVNVELGMVLYEGKIVCVGSPKNILKNIQEHGYEGCARKCLSA